MILAPNWTEQEKALLAEYVDQPLDVIATFFEEAFNDEETGFYVLRSKDAIRRKIKRQLSKPGKTKVFEKVLEDDVTEETETLWNTVWQRLSRLQKQYSKLQLTRTRGIVKDKTLTKILSLSDIHFPFARLDFLEQILEEHGDADILVINGDLMEGYLFSTYEKDERVLTIDEYNAAFMFVYLCSKLFPKVVLVEGNHDDRAGRALSKAGISKDSLSVFNLSLMGRIANGERLDSQGKLIEKIHLDNVFFEQHESWYVRIGKTLFIHPSTMGSAKPGFTVAGWNEKFSTRYSPGEYDSIVCGHTHQIYKGIVNNTLLIEQGCLAGLLTYSWSRRALYKGNGQNGYAVIYQDQDGNTDFNKSGPVYLGEVLPPKKNILELE
jgi:predicted phosphodiesterase